MHTKKLYFDLFGTTVKEFAMKPQATLSGYEDGDPQTWEKLNQRFELFWFLIKHTFYIGILLFEHYYTKKLLQNQKKKQVC